MSETHVNGLRYSLYDVCKKSKAGQ